MSQPFSCLLVGYVAISDELSVSPDLPASSSIVLPRRSRLTPGRLLLALAGHQCQPRADSVNFGLLPIPDTVTADGSAPGSQGRQDLHIGRLSRPDRVDNLAMTTGILVPSVARRGTRRSPSSRIDPALTVGQPRSSSSRNGPASLSVDFESSDEAFFSSVASSRTVSVPDVCLDGSDGSPRQRTPTARPGDVVASVHQLGRPGHSDRIDESGTSGRDPSCRAALAAALPEGTRRGRPVAFEMLEFSMLPVDRSSMTKTSWPAR